MIEQASTPEYEEFVLKFKPKKTTDDCHTPPDVYEAVRGWAVAEFGLQGREVVRPFWPGADYTRAEYPEGCVVIDNPPFSCLTDICRWYMAHAVDFVLFAPSLTCFNLLAVPGVHIVPSDATTRYENGAEVNTSLATNLGEHMVMVRQSLTRTLKSVKKQRPRAALKRRLEYDPHIVRYASVARLHGDVDIDGTFIGNRLANGHHPFGGGMLVSDGSVEAIERARTAPPVTGIDDEPLPQPVEEVEYIGLTEEELAIANSAPDPGTTVRRILATKNVRKLEEWA